MVATLLVTARVGFAQQPAPAIADNSFLVEEAYNQERGVVQHISGFLWHSDVGAWLYTFTQEWPLWGQTHQASYTVPVGRPGAAGATRLGNVALNYRYQMLGGEGGGLAVAPRLTLLLPTGTEPFGVQVGLPVSVRLASRLVAHGNAGATVAEATPGAVTLAGSVIWLMRPTFNLLVEAVWTRSQGDTWLVSPGVRWAHNLARGLQIVPGIGLPVSVSPRRSAPAAFFYLSFEHPFGGGEH